MGKKGGTENGRIGERKRRQKKGKLQHPGITNGKRGKENGRRRKEEEEEKERMEKLQL